MADAVGWALIQAGAPPHIHYLDDFLFFVSPAATHGPLVLSRILEAFGMLGVPVAMHKIEGPATVVTFLGVEVDTVRFELRLPGHKLDHIQGLVRA